MSHRSIPHVGSRAVGLEMRVLWYLWATVLENHCVGNRLVPWKGPYLRTLGHCLPVLPVAGSFSLCEDHSLVSERGELRGCGRSSPRGLSA